MALTRFRRTLKISRLWVRCLTHTFHLPPAITEIYGGPRSTWLLEVLENLPNLQSLLVSELPFFDHSALTAFRTGRADQGHYELRLLLAQREPNTTSLGLAQALLYFPRLVYLDLSYTTPARDVSVLSMLSQLLDLQVLKLRGIGLRDPEAEVLANAIGTRVRLLDLRDNFLTDTALRSLLQACFLPPDADRNETVQSYLNPRYEWSLSAVPSANILSEDSLRSEHLDAHLIAQLTRPLTGRTGFEDLPHVGVTHLYVANNNISVEGLMSLLKTSRLHVLDGGTVDTAESIKRRRQTNTSVGEENNFITTVRFPGAEKLIPALGRDAAERLTYLRVHHAVVTEDAPVRESLSVSSLIPELPAENSSMELETLFHQTPELDAVDNQRYELPGGEVPIFELADTSVSTTIGNRGKPTQQVPGRRGKRDAREDAVPSNIEEAQTAAEAGTPQQGRTPTLRLPSDSDLPEAIPSPIPPPSPSQVRANKIQQLLAKRPKNSILPHLNVEDADFPYLHPSHIPHLQTLVLTDVPSSVPKSSPILKTLIRFLSACADEALLASLQARSDYSLPPGWARANAELKHAKSLFSLERIVIEITPVRKSRIQNGPRAWIHQVHGESKSSTGDIDSENLWAAAANDFSFFGDEECGVPDNDPDRLFPMSTLNEKVLLVPEDDESVHSPSRSESESPGPRYAVNNRSDTTRGERRFGRPGPITRTSSVQLPAPQPEPDIDLVQALASFRRSKKYEYEALLRTERQQRESNAGGRSVSPLSPCAYSPSPVSPINGNTAASGIPLHVEGHWKGEVQVVRNPTPGGRSGVVDIYGNYFEKGYLYP